MASLPIDPTFARQAPYTPKPNIRVVFLPGPAQTAMAGELAKLPAETQEATLEELEIAALARDVIALAKTRLSTALYPAFLRWADAAILCMTDTGEIGDAPSDFPECDRRYVAACNARDDVHRIPAVTGEDYTFKTYLIELMNRQDAFSPLEDGGSFKWSSDPATLAEKVDAFVARLYQSSNGDPVLRVGTSNAARQPFLDAIAGMPVQALAGLPLRSLLIERNAIIERIRDDEKMDDASIGAACEELNRLDMIITASPASTADDAVVKLLTLAQINAEGHEVDESQFVQAIIETRKHFGIGYVSADPAAGGAADEQRFSGHGANVQSDKLLLETFATMQGEMRLWFDHGPGTQEEDVAADARASALEDVLFTQRANTIEGVIAQLRETFRHLDGNAWSDHATLDPDHPEFQRGVKNTGFFTRALWHSVEDLARIGGVSLTEVRA